jgi:hypothetical protein
MKEKCVQVQETTELVKKFVVTTKRKFKEIVTCVPNYSTPKYATVLWIRIRLDPKLLAGSGSGTEQFRIGNEIEIKLQKKASKI